MSGWTQTPNFIYDLMADMKEAEIKVVMAVARQTFGWRQERVALRMVDFEEMTGLSRPSVNTGIQSALKRGVLKREAKGDSFDYWLTEPAAEVSMVKNFNHEADEDSKNSLPPAVKNLNQEAVKNFNPNKRNINTNTPKKRERGQPPHASRIVSANGRGTKTLHHRSPYLDARRFVNGFVPPGTGRNAVEVYYERFEIASDEWRLTTPLEDDLVAICKDLELLREVVTAYDRANFKKPRNIDLILDWYRHPERFRKDHHANHHGHPAANYEPPRAATFSQREWQEYHDPRADEIPY